MQSTNRAIIYSQIGLGLVIYTKYVRTTIIKGWLEFETQSRDYIWTKYQLLSRMVFEDYFRTVSIASVDIYSMQMNSQ